MASITGFESAGSGPEGVGRGRPGCGDAGLAALRQRLAREAVAPPSSSEPRADSGVADAAAARALADAEAAIDELFAAGVDPADARDAVVWIEELERLGRRLDAARAALVGSIQRQVLHTADGHGSAKIMVRHVARLTEAEALARAKTARLAADVPKVTAGRGRPVRCRRVRCGRWGGWMRTLGSLQRYVSVTTSFWLMPKRWVRRRLGTRCTGGHG